MGFDVDSLNTVQFSNHTGYPSWTGKKFNAEDVQELFDGLEKNELMEEYTHVLTGKKKRFFYSVIYKKFCIGYIGNYAILEKIERMVQKLKSKNTNLIYGNK